jgi:hypothetical protein
MKIILTEEETAVFLKKIIPKEMLPEGMEVKNVEGRGYPLKEFVITVEPKADNF